MDLTELGFRDQTATKSVLGCLSQQLGRKVLASTVVQRAARIGGGDGAEPRPIPGGHIAMVQHDPLRDAEASTTPGTRQCEMEP